MKSDTNLLDINRPDTIRMSVDEATQLGAQALRHLGYIDEDVSIIVDQLIDNALCGYHFAWPATHTGDGQRSQVQEAPQTAQGCA